MFLSQPWWGAVAPCGAGPSHLMQGCPQISGICRGSEEFLSSSMCLVQSKSLPLPQAKKTLYVHPFTCIPAALVLVCHIPEERAVSSRPLAGAAWGGSCLAGGAVLTFSGAAPGPHSARQWTSAAPVRPPSAWSWLCLDVRVCSALGPSVMP